MNVPQLCQWAQTVAPPPGWTASMTKCDQAREAIDKATGDGRQAARKVVSTRLRSQCRVY